MKWVSPSRITDELRMKIIKLRVESDLTQRDLAKRFGISDASVARLLKACNLSARRKTGTLL